MDFGLLHSLMGDGPQMPPVRDPIPSHPSLPVNPAQAAPMPAVTAPERPSLLQRVGHALAAAEGGLSNAIRPDTPAGYDFLTPGEIASARPSLFRTIFTGNGGPASEQFVHNLDAIVQRKELGVGLAQQARIMAMRQSLLQKFPPPTSGDEAETAHWANQVLPHLMMSQDDKGVALLQPIVNQFAKDLHERSFEPQLFKGPNGDFKYLDPSESTAIPKGYTRVEKPTGSASYDFFLGKDGQGAYVMKGDNAGVERQVALGRRPLSNENIMIGQEGANTRFDSRQVNTLQKQYRSDIAPLVKNATQYDKALYTFDRAMHSTDPIERKALYGSVMSQFVQSGDQPNNLRFQLLKYYESHINPSIAGSFDIFMNKMSRGELPPAILNAMVAHIKGLQSEAHAQIEARRQGFLNTNAGRLEDADLPTTDTYFPFMGSYSKPAPGGVRSLDINDVEAYLKDLRSKKR